MFKWVAWVIDKFQWIFDKVFALITRRRNDLVFDVTRVRARLIDLQTISISCQVIRYDDTRFVITRGKLFVSPVKVGSFREATENEDVIELHPMPEPNSTFDMRYTMEDGVTALVDLTDKRSINYSLKYQSGRNISVQYKYVLFGLRHFIDNATSVDQYDKKIILERSRCVSLRRQ